MISFKKVLHAGMMLPPAHWEGPLRSVSLNDALILEFGTGAAALASRELRGWAALREC